MDDIDFAQRNQADDISRALAARTVLAGEALTHCERCGDEIPEKRRQAAPGCRHCLECKQLIERGATR